MRCYRLQFLIVFIGFASVLYAHENWLFIESPEFELGDRVVIHLQSGHHLGQSEFLIDPTLIQEAFIILPDGEKASLDFSVIDEEYVSTYTPQQKGHYCVSVNLRKRHKGPFIYLMQTHFSVGPTQACESNTESPLAIQIENDQAQVFSAGEIVKAPILIMNPLGQEQSLIMDRQGSSTLPPGSEGFMVAVTHFRRQTASLGFFAGR